MERCPNLDQRARASRIFASTSTIWMRAKKWQGQSQRRLVVVWATVHTFWAYCWWTFWTNFWEQKLVTATQTDRLIRALIHSFCFINGNLCGLDIVFKVKIWGKMWLWPLPVRHWGVYRTQRWTGHCISQLDARTGRKFKQFQPSQHS